MNNKKKRKKITRTNTLNKLQKIRHLLKVIFLEAKT